ncbi:MAG: hypothetical protein AAF633_09705 [Chloroflexota bacterium]
MRQYLSTTGSASQLNVIRPDFSGKVSVADFFENVYSPHPRIFKPHGSGFAVSIVKIRDL